MHHVTGERTAAGEIEPVKSEAALVSVVIVTLDRPKLLRRALESVFNQTYPQLEVIVVLDRPDEATTALLHSIDDPRLVIVVSPRQLTCPAARNLGADHANGEWITFLDDDDEWLPGKIEVQIAFAEGREDVLISCLSRVVTPRSTYILPARIFDNSVPLDDYLFHRPSPFSPQGFIQTSSFFMSRSLFSRTRFPDNSLHDDWEFILRLSKQFRIRIDTVPEVLAILYFEEQRSTQTTRRTWKESLTWVDMMRPILTRRAYGCFCLSTVASKAVSEHAYTAFPILLYRAFRLGSPSLWRTLTFVSLWVLPLGLYQRLKSEMKLLAH
jgi:glycosyltransferase involved in cell wall biosynthesis